MSTEVLLTFEAARLRVLGDLTKLSGERVSVSDSVGRVLAEDLWAARPMPGFDHSAMDGYAVRASEAIAGALLALRGESRTGGEPPGELLAETVCRIFTGARLPLGADTVLMQEHATREGDGVRVGRALQAGENVRRAGEDIAVGAKVLSLGTRLTAFHVGLLSALERSRVTVSRRPVVTILSTGDELREPGSPDFAGSVIDANGPGLSALARMCGAEARLLPFARDDIGATRRSLESALDGSDVVITVGGVSVGDHDLVRGAMADVGITLDFWRVAIKPGKPLCMGRAPRGQRVLGLPGNPSSAMLTFVLFGAPMLRGMQSDARPAGVAVRAVLSRSLRHVAGRLEFVRGRLNEEVSPSVLAVSPNQSSGSPASFAWANALGMLPSERGDLAAGSEVDCLRLEDV